MKRTITFDRFFNINRADAEAQLADQEVGSYLFRPSAHGPDCFILTIEFSFNQYAHYLIVEKEQPTLGELRKKLFVEETLFEDLEEIK
jgi:transcription elongation factor SPT6